MMNKNTPLTIINDNDLSNIFFIHQSLLKTKKSVQQCENTVNVIKLSIQ